MPEVLNAYVVELSVFRDFLHCWESFCPETRWTFYASSIDVFDISVLWDTSFVKFIFTNYVLEAFKIVFFIEFESGSYS